MSANNFRMYDTKYFTQVWESSTLFKEDYTQCSLYTAPTYNITNGVTTLTNDNNSLENDVIDKLYYLLYARYGNTPIAFYDENQFKYNVFALIFEYGPSWQKELKLQQKLRTLQEDELQEGHFAIYNHAAHDATAPSTNTKTELDYINDQNTTRTKKGKLTAYNDLLILLKKDVTKAFIDKFAKLFNPIIDPYRHGYYYTTKINDEETVDD